MWSGYFWSKIVLPGCSAHGVQQRMKILRRRLLKQQLKGRCLLRWQQLTRNFWLKQDPCNFHHLTCVITWYGETPERLQTFRSRSRARCLYQRFVHQKIDLDLSHSVCVCPASVSGKCWFVCQPVNPPYCPPVGFCRLTSRSTLPWTLLYGFWQMSWSSMLWTGPSTRTPICYMLLFQWMLHSDLDSFSTKR